ncbi:MAG: TetR/AcrR family transcriptional regulator [Anaerolineae bacterium]|nr:TetR/AcrR family transcriptional regulator [Anaerolineae bacterium]
MKKQNSQKKREAEVYAVAARLFATKGFHATRMQDIADELGMQKGSLYYYFNSKDDLLKELVTGSIQEAQDSLQTILDSDQSPKQKLALAITEHLRILQQNADLHLINAQEILMSLDEETAVTTNTRLKNYENIWSAIVQEGIDTGDFRPDLDQKIIVKALLGLCNSTLTWFEPTGRLSNQQIAQIYTELMINGLQSANTVS